MREPLSLQYEPIPDIILGYPQASEVTLKKRRSQLAAWGITSMIPAGSKQIGAYRVLGLGYVGVVIHVLWQDQPIALKIRRMDASQESLILEGESLSQANQVGIGPGFIQASQDFLLMALIKGPTLLTWLAAHSHKDHKSRRQAIVRDILAQAFALDQYQLDRGDMGCLTNDVIIHNQNEPVLLDFSKASVSRRPHNLTTALPGLLWGSRTAAILAADFSPQIRQSLLLFLKKYKQQPTEARFQAIIDLL